MAYAEQRAVNNVVPLLMEFAKPEMQSQLSAYTIEELEYMLLNSEKYEIDGYAFRTAVESFKTALSNTGNITNVGEETEVSAEIDGKQIIVHVLLKGEKKDAQAEVIFSNDMFLKMESAALNPIDTMGELMKKAALNTLIGMGTVFAVLILISLIIYCFAFIPKIQAMFSKKDKKDAKAIGVDNALAQIVTQEESGTDDLELVAVIAAAIAASEGAASTDGFVVRSIRRRR